MHNVFASGEHGIGLVKTVYIAKEIGVYGVEVSKKVKQAIDPKNIMNPGINIELYKPFFHSFAAMGLYIPPTAVIYNLAIVHMLD